MANRIFISFLGTNNYIQTRYSLGETISEPVRFIQEALIEILCKDWDEYDRICIFCTDGETGSKTRNWDDNGHERVIENKAIESQGLARRLESKRHHTDNPLTPEIECRIIPEGFDENEIWQIFQNIYDAIKENDHIYMDVTHAFRSIPIFSTVLLDYSRRMKNTSVDGIFYGAFEKLGPVYKVKEIPVENRCAPIIELSGIINLQDTITAANNFKDFGKFGAISTMSSRKREKSSGAVTCLKKTLDNLDDYIAVCRMADIKEAKFTVTIAGQRKSVMESSIISPAEKMLLEEICNKILSDFDRETPDKNIESAIFWAIEHNMIQQAYTLAQEHIISLVSNKYININPYNTGDRKKDIKDFRIFISSILGIPDGTSFEEYKDPLASHPDIARTMIENDTFIRNLRKPYKLLVDNRNNINHAKGTKTKGQFEGDLRIILSGIFQIIKEN